MLGVDLLRISWHSQGVNDGVSTRADGPERFRWQVGRTQIELEFPEDAPVRASWLSCPLPGGTIWSTLVGLLASGHGRHRSSQALYATAVGDRLRYVRHDQSSVSDQGTLIVEQRDDVTGLVVTWIATAFEDVEGFTSTIGVRNDGQSTVRLESVSSLACVLVDSARRGETTIHTARSDWLAEFRWSSCSASYLLPDVDIDLHGQDPRGVVEFASAGMWSTGSMLPQGMLTLADSRGAIAWEVETSGSWSWQLFERDGAFRLTACGPSLRVGGWQCNLQPGERWATVSASVVAAAGGVDGVLGELTRLRRRRRIKSGTAGAGAVVYNDYMNTVMGDPNSSRLLPLIDAAAQVGATVFCVDAGWYRDVDASNDQLGKWTEAKGRFDGGLSTVIGRIRDADMIAGLWLEPEVVTPSLAEKLALSVDSYVRRGGHIVTDWERWHLDLSQDHVRDWLDDAVDELVSRYGVGYFKLDYNTDIGGGGGELPGAQELAHLRGLYAWLHGLSKRHPGILIEVCASGAMRADGAMLTRADLQSTSDQQSEILYAAIAAASPSAMPPEQAANWAYPQPGMSEERMIFTLSNGMLTRLYLSGWLDRLSSRQTSLVVEAVRSHRDLLPLVHSAVPAWPLGLPGWRDEWLALALRSVDRIALTVWHRPGETSSVPSHVRIRIDDLKQSSSVRMIFPTDVEGWQFEISDGAIDIRCTIREPSARTVMIETASDALTLDAARRRPIPSTYSY